MNKKTTPDSNVKDSKNKTSRDQLEPRIGLADLADETLAGVTGGQTHSPGGRGKK